MHHAGFTLAQAGGMIAVVQAASGGLHTDKTHVRIVHKSGEQADGIGAAAHTGESGHRQFPAFGEHLLARFTADDGLKMTDHRGIGMRADRRTEHIEGIGIGDPRGERLVHGFLERALAGKRGHDLRAEHLHADDVQALALHVLGAHVHGALQPEQGRRRRRRHAMLPRAGLRYDPLLAHPLRQQTLAQRIVDLVRAEMVQILTLEINLGPAEAFAQIGAEKDGIRTPGVVLEIVIQLVLEKGIVAIPIKGFGHFVKTRLQIIGDKLPAVSAEETGGFGSGEGSGRRIHGSFLILGRDTTTKKPRPVSRPRLDVYAL